MYVKQKKVYFKKMKETFAIHLPDLKTAGMWLYYIKYIDF